MKGNDILVSLMDKFKLRSPIPDTVRNAAVKNQSKILKNVFRLAGEYSAYYGAGISVYYTVKKFGFKISFTAAKIITVIIPSFFLAVILAATVWGIKSLDKPEALPVDESVVEEKPSMELKKDKILTGKKIISIRRFKSEDESLNEYISKFATFYVSDGLIGSVRGFKIIDPRSNLRAPSDSEYRIEGSAGKLGQIIVINARLIEGESGNILLLCEEEIYSPDDLEMAGKKIAAKISDYFSKNIKN